MIVNISSYLCVKCGNEFSAFITDEADKSFPSCPHCGSEKTMKESSPEEIKNIFRKKGGEKQNA